MNEYATNDAVQFWVEHKLEYYMSVYMPVMVWLIISTIFIVVMFRKYTFGDWTKENPNPCDGETFNMPRGTVRGILTMSLLFITVVIELANVRIVGLESEFSDFLAAFQMMVAFYFGAKVMHHINSVDKTKTKAIAEAAAAIESAQTNGATYHTAGITSEVGETVYDNSYFAEEGAAG
ncbi:MAG: DUF1182 domain-containing protein [Bacteroidales bacterium]|nr:DUF1182 domain-containing protein [Bacteroidales bacterium]